MLDRAFSASVSRSRLPAAVAKRWDVPLDKKVGAGGKREYPPEQIGWYLDRGRKDSGVLTNGRLWRLVPRALGGPPAAVPEYTPGGSRH
ncbi:MAG: hypothetical protein K2X87_30120 [Gemmataceae bacterium]|nr:hypothetical protein [Gemmataceae bacterium]